MTRHSNRQDRWGPCVDRRGRAGNRIEADLKLSIHADGSTPGRVASTSSRPPTAHRGPTTSTRLQAARPATKAALRRRGIPVANYTAGGRARLPGDLATLNLSDVPTVVVELGNMRNPKDARRMTSASGRATYAKALRVPCDVSCADSV